MRPVIDAIHPDVDFHFDLLMEVCEREELSIPQTAYVLAVAHQESKMGLWMEDHTSGWCYEGNRSLGNTEEGDGRKYRARGYAGMVGRNAYQRWAAHLELPLLDKPELVSEPTVAAEILVVGMKLGRFTNRALSSYINESKVDYMGARRVLPSIDKPVQIAAHARQFEAALEGVPATGPTRSDIKKLQRCLVKIGWPVAIDGLLSPLTRRAIVDFQSGYTLVDLPVDGLADPLTRLAITSCADNDGFASEHFRFAEFRTEGKAELGINNRVIRVERNLVLALEGYRRAVGGPVGIASGYRSIDYNRAIGGRPDSEHVQGRAVHVREPVLPAELVENLGMFTSIGVRNGFAVHLGVGSGEEAAAPCPRASVYAIS